MPALSDAQTWAIANALRVAAKQYDSDAHDFDCIPNHERLAQGARDQARHAIELANRLEGASLVVIED